jgi:hypothetical protein
MVLTMLTVSACSRSGVGRDVELTEPAFKVAPAESESAPEGAVSPPSVRVSPGHFEVLGLLSTPNPCQDIQASLPQVGAALTVTIQAHAQPGVCIQVLGRFAYQVTEDIDPDTYTLRLTHTYPDTGWPDERAFQGSITVP